MIFKFKSDRKRNFYIKMAGRIERELNLPYNGSTDLELINFVNHHREELDEPEKRLVRWTHRQREEHKKPKKHKPLQSAPTKKGGLYRKHGDKEFKQQ